MAINPGSSSPFHPIKKTNRIGLSKPILLNFQTIANCKDTENLTKVTNMHKMFYQTIMKIGKCGNIQALKDYDGLNFEALKGDLNGLHSIRLNKKYRFICAIDSQEPHIIYLNKISDHYHK